MGIQEDKRWYEEKSKADHKAAMGRAHNREMNEIQNQKRKISCQNKMGIKGVC